MGKRFWKKKSETKILYSAHVNVTEPNEVLNIGFFYSQYLVPFRFTTFASSFYIPPTFSLENVFIYLYPLFLILLSMISAITGKC